uniref:Uncharacterized protein n=1 Tax=Cacopsylla melanoneura TaxID=428564 RepID=A0A8D8U046_9HEMI
MTSSNSSRSTLLSLITKCLLSSTVMLMAASLQGDWLFLYFNIKRHMDSNWSYNGTVQQSFAQFSGYFKDLPTIWLSSCLVGYGIYFAVGGFLHENETSRTSGSVNQPSGSPESWNWMRSRWDASVCCPPIH